MSRAIPAGGPAGRSRSGIDSVPEAVWSPLAAGTPLALLDVPAPPAQVIALDPSARRLTLSPSARQFAVQVGRARSGLPYRFIVGRLDGDQQPTSAFDVTFVDDRLLLLLGPTATGLGLRASALVPDPTGELLPQAYWSVALPPVYMPRVSTDAATGAWTVVGWHPDDADAISVAGRLGDSMPEVKRWSIPGADANATFFYLPATRTAFLVTTTKLPYRAAVLSRVAGVPERRWELRKLDGTNGATLAVTAASLTCLDPLPHDTTLLCLARHAAHTVIWSVDGRSGALREMGAVPPYKWAALSAARLRFVMPDGAVLEIPRGARQGTRFTPRAAGDIVEISSTDRHLAMLLRSANEVRLSLYESR